MLKALVPIAIPLLLAGPSLAGETVTVTKESCQRLVVHTPGADTEYLPGADVQGRPVAPADLPGSPAISAPTSFAIAIGIELDERLGLGQGGRYKGTMPVGAVTVVEGRVYFEGELLADRDQAAIAAGCRERFGNGR
jgi:hypothetical protein